MRPEVWSFWGKGWGEEEKHADHVIKKRKRVLLAKIKQVGNGDIAQINGSILGS